MTTSLVCVLLCRLQILCRMLRWCLLSSAAILKVTDRVIISYIYVKSSENISVLGNPGNSVLFSFTLTCDNATGRMSKDASHVVGLITAPWLAPRSALNSYRRSSSPGLVLSLALLESGWAQLRMLWASQTNVILLKMSLPNSFLRQSSRYSDLSSFVVGISESIFYFRHNHFYFR